MTEQEEPPKEPFTFKKYASIKINYVSWCPDIIFVYSPISNIYYDKKGNPIN